MRLTEGSGIIKELIKKDYTKPSEPFEDQSTTQEETEVDLLFDIENPPYDDPTKFLKFLKWYNGKDRYLAAAAKSDHKNRGGGDYDYDSLQISPEMIPAAIAWAKKKGFDPILLNPAQIVSVPSSEIDDANIETFLLRKKHWIENLQNNANDLREILFPNKRIYIHATGRTRGEMDAQLIIEKGLNTGNEASLRHTAIGLYRNFLNEDGTSRAEAEIIEKNFNIITNPHRGFDGNSFIIIIQLPELTKEQSQENDLTEFYPERTEGENFVLPPKYIAGYLNLDTGEFKKNSFFET